MRATDRLIKYAAVSGRALLSSLSALQRFDGPMSTSLDAASYRPFARREGGCRRTGSLAQQCAGSFLFNWVLKINA